MRCDLTSRSTRTRCCKAPRAVQVSVRLAAPCSSVPVNSNVMRQLAEKITFSEAPARAGSPCPSSARRAGLGAGSRTTARLWPVADRAVPVAGRLARALNRQCRFAAVAHSTPSQAGLIRRRAFGQVRCGRYKACASILTPHALHNPWHNWPVDTDAQGRPLPSVAPFPGRRSPSRYASPGCYALA